MPTVFPSGPFRFFFYAGDGGEPPHIHVERDDCEAKFWLDPIRLERSHGFSKFSGALSAQNGAHRDERHQSRF